MSIILTQITTQLFKRVFALRFFLEIIDIGVHCIFLWDYGHLGEIYVH